MLLSAMSFMNIRKMIAFYSAGSYYIILYKLVLTIFSVKLLFIYKKQIWYKISEPLNRGIISSKLVPEESDVANRAPILMIFSGDLNQTSTHTSTGFVSTYRTNSLLRKFWFALVNPSENEECFIIHLAYRY